MSKYPRPQMYHYLNPWEGETMRSPYLCFLPRRCGYELHTRPSDFRIDGATRGPQCRALFKYTISGEGCCRLNHSLVPLKPGDALLLSVPGDYCYFFPKHAEKWEFLFLSFWHPAAAEMIGKMAEEFGNVVALSPDGEALSKAWSLYEFYRNGNEMNADRYAVSRTGYDFLMSLCREAQEDGPGMGWSSRARRGEENLVGVVTAYCRRHLDRPVSVEALAKLCGYSRWHFSKRFHRLSGKSPGEFMTELRLDAALQYLQQSGGPSPGIKEIAASCGFSDTGYFIRRFRARFGVTPGRFRELL